MGLLTDSEKGLLNQDSIEEARKGKIVYLDLEDIRLNPENIWTVNDEEIRINDFLYQDIYEEGLADRIEIAIEQTAAYYAMLDQIK